MPRRTDAASAIRDPDIAVSPIRRAQTKPARNACAEYWRKAGLGPLANPVVQEQAKYSEERQREQIRMQVRAELEAEFEKKRQVERQAAWEREV